MAGAKQELSQDLVGKLTQALGSQLVSVVLYGSAAAGEHETKFSDVNVLCVLRRITPAELGAAEPVFRWWQQKGNPSPLLLTEEEVKSSADCFPVEFHDIRARHRILFGEDVVAGISIGNGYYRAQVENELRAKLLRLRQKAAAVLSDKDVLRRLLIDSVSTFCVLFRHALLLHGVECGTRKRDVVARAGEKFGLSTAPFEKLLDLREERVKAKEVEPAALLGEYLGEIGKVIEAVDLLEKGVNQ